MKEKTKYILLLFIFIISLIVSIILSLNNAERICDSNKGCDVVQNSKYAQTFGIKNSHYGLIIFFILSIITVSHIKNPKVYKNVIITLSIIIGSVIAVYFLYLQQFILKSYCKYCLIVDLIAILSLILIIKWKK